MPVFDLVTTDDNTETVADVMERAIGATQATVESDIASVNAGGPTPALLINGVSAGNTIPNIMLSMYEQFYNQSLSVQHTTGLSYSASLQAGGFAPYTGQGS